MGWYIYRLEENTINKMKNQFKPEIGSRVYSPQLGDERFVVVGYACYHAKDSTIRDRIVVTDSRGEFHIFDEIQFEPITTPTEYSITLSEYEIANLKSFLQITGYGVNDETCIPILSSGDWVGQIYNKLPNVKCAPNRTYKEQLRAIVSHFKHQLDSLFSTEK